ncbi:unnamed protein product [Bursaphelenchus xylophilus]|uniref:(pine wood nematode) hypothetical protein n=1 Tax=Bursaphelenchus xylophilus TaxID=6326 RepID=A0A7I8WT00_BURXY|nr:unnamed protein product [Bursaphelenchus xylophilus]CAG9115656.1 unnamed protein product [Bursaphelenchus xylophilus]
MFQCPGPATIENECSAAGKDLNPSAMPTIRSWMYLLWMVSVFSGVRCLRQVLVEGDLMLGGLFPIHESGRSAQQCGRIKADQGVQRMVAMLFALEEINTRNDILPDLRLGAQILDTCSVETHALEQSLQFIKTVLSKSSALQCNNEGEHQQIIGVIGAAGSQVSVMVASMLQPFKIPMLSYSSTGVELSEKPRFQYFSRVVPPDNLQAKAMAHVVAKLGWNFLHAVVDTGSYGERGMDSFRSAAIELGICIDGEIHKVSRRWSDDQFKDLLIRMRQSNKARGVVMFVDEDNLRRFLTNLKSMITSGKHPEMKKYFWFIASDSWGMKTAVIQGFEDIVLGAITIAPRMRHVPKFNEYFHNLGPKNTFLSEYWKSMNCSDRINENFGKCFKSVNYKFKQEAYVPSVVDSVYVMARAIHNYIEDHCHSIEWQSCALSHIGFDGALLQRYYRNISLEVGHPPLIDANGDGIGQYSIFQLGKEGVYSPVGSWRTGVLREFNVEQVRKGLQAIDGSRVIPMSVCSVPCELGYYRAYQDMACCWTCIPCDISTSIIVNETSCIQCPLGKIPNHRFDSCRPIQPVHLQWSSVWALSPSVFSLLGLTATIFVTSVFVRYNNTPVVMASGRELCYCMLFGIALCYLATFVLVSRPSTYSCALSRVLIGLSMCAVYAAILIKTNRLARVFKPSSPVRPKLISPPAQ